MVLAEAIDTAGSTFIDTETVTEVQYPYKLSTVPQTEWIATFSVRVKTPYSVYSSFRLSNKLVKI